MVNFSNWNACLTKKLYWNDTSIVFGGTDDGQDVMDSVRKQCRNFQGQLPAAVNVATRNQRWLLHVVGGTY
jgi:hypothetical protein